jgi:hypothetical protein
LVPGFTERPPDAADPRNRWLAASEQLLLLFARLGVDPEEQSSLLHEAIDADALDALAATPTATVSFELWDHWVRITPDVIEVYAPDSHPDDAKAEL